MIFEGFLVMKILISGLSCKIKTPKIRRRHLFLGAGDFVLRAQRLHRWLRHQRDQALSHSRRSSTGREEGPRLRTWNQKISSNMIWYYIYTYIMYIYIMLCIYILCIYIYCVYIYYIINWWVNIPSHSFNPYPNVTRRISKAVTDADVEIGTDWLGAHVDQSQDHEEPQNRTRWITAAKKWTWLLIAWMVATCWYGWFLLIWFQHFQLIHPTVFNMIQLSLTVLWEYHGISVGNVQPYGVKRRGLKFVEASLWLWDLLMITTGNSVKCLMSNPKQLKVISRLCTVHMW